MTTLRDATSDGELPVFGDDVSWEEAQAALQLRELSDGLPMVPPTRARLDSMLAGVAEPDRSHGSLMPLCGDLSAAAVAYQCVLAGCTPSHLPVVLTALVGCADDSFNLLGISTTTGTPAVAVVVHGGPQLVSDVLLLVGREPFVRRQRRQVVGGVPRSVMIRGRHTSPTRL